VREERTGPVAFFTSAAIILYEVTLSRIFSVLMWYHFVSLVVAIALCGMAAGSLFSVRTARMTDRESASFSARFLFFAFFSLLCIYLLLVSLSRFPSLGYRILSPLHQTYYEPFVAASAGKGGSFVTTVAAIALFLSIPFFGGGAVFAACFERGRYDFWTYFNAMAGSAFGVILYLCALKTGSGPFALLLASSLFLVALAFLRNDISGMSRFMLYFFLALVLVIMGYDLARRPADPRFVRGRYVSDILWSKWDAVSRVAVYPLSADELLKGFGQGRLYGGSAPAGLGMVVDDTGYTAMFGDSGDNGFDDFFRHNIASLPYLLKKEGKALIIGPGGGKDIYSARSSGDFSVDAVEVNALVVRAVQEVFGTFTGRPYTGRGVTMHVKEGRSFLEKNREKYDVIQMTQVFGRVPPQAGAFTLTENHLYTLEAAGRMVDSLRDGGILSITRFAFEKTGPRLVRMLRDALIRKRWENPENAFLIAGSRGIMNVMVVRGGADEGLQRRFRDECQGRGFDILYLPESGSDGLIPEIVRGKFIPKRAGFDLSPPTDDRPFFYYTLLPRDFIRGKQGAGETTEERSAYLIRKFLLFALVLSLVVPLTALLFPGSRRTGGRFAMLLSFLLTGMGFIMVEIILIKKLILPLGFPVYSLSCILLAVFVFSGSGPALFSLLEISERKKTVIAAISLAAILLLYRFFLDRVIVVLMQAPDVAKYGASFLLTGLAAIFMGVPFPSLLTLYNRNYRGSKSVPVAVNGFASVAGSMLALAVSMNFGYGTVFLLAGGVYVFIALLALVA
jgi:hypothetical protein